MRPSNLFDLTDKEQQKVNRRYSEYLFDKWMIWSFTIKGKVLFKEVLEMRKKYRIDG